MHNTKYFYNIVYFQMQMNKIHRNEHLITIAIIIAKLA